MNKNSKNNSNNNKNSKKLILIAFAAIAVVVIAFSVKFPNKSNAGVTENGNKTAVETNQDTVDETKEETSAQLPVTKDSDLVIPVKDLSETATFYPAEIDGIKLEVLAVKAPDGTIRTAFNTCQVCYTSGNGYYVQDGDVLVCQNCGNRFGMGDVEVTKGGCNPVPITVENKTVTDDTITISKDFLSQATVIFENWK
ncbi:MAG: DUF2318 domain-containing protein [Mobilitalea sp.]